MKCRAAFFCLLAGLSVGQLWAQARTGAEFQVNTYVTGSQGRPSVASDAAGNFVVAWQSYGQDGDQYGVVARRYQASGRPRGDEFRVNTHTTSVQRSPSVASAPDGSFIVAWESGGQDGSGAGVFGRRYDASGSPLGSEFQINSYATEQQTNPAVAVDESGNFVVVWQSYGQDGGGLGIFGQRFDSSGVKLGSEWQINTQTLEHQWSPAVAAGSGGGFVVVWTDNAQYPVGGVSGQRYDASGMPLGSEFQVNTYTTNNQLYPSVAANAAGSFVVTWQSWQDGSGWGVFAQRYDSTGAALGAEFQVNSYTNNWQAEPSVAMDASGGFVVVWDSFSGQDGDGFGIFGQRYDASGVKRGTEFQVNTHTTDYQRFPSAAIGNAGTFVVAWQSAYQDGSDYGVFGQRYYALLDAAALAVDPSATSGSDGNGVLEPGETTVAVAPSWRNLSGASESLAGTGLSFAGPPASGVSYDLTNGTGSYGTVANGATAPCSDCYEVGVGFGGTRPATHWDATFTEQLTPAAIGQTKPWALHIGESFTDVPKTSGYYRFVETLLHKNVTGGCSATTYCPTTAVTREQMSVFVLAGKEGSGYAPAACATPVFPDVPASSPFCRFIEELARRRVVSGCGGGNFCPTSAVTRDQMSVFLLRTLDPVLSPPACTTPMFPDVPASNPFCRWVEELARRGITSGCGGGNYCPASPVTREQMAVFISATFGLTLYGP